MRAARLLVSLLAALACSGIARAGDLDEATAARFAQLALDCVHKEYPNKIAHYMQSDADLKPPRELTPAFFGCYDWHSSVHGHWLLVRVAKHFPGSDTAKAARAALARSLTPQNIAAEVTYLTSPGRESFERPYGIAWLLQLAAELRASDDSQAQSEPRLDARGNCARTAGWRAASQRATSNRDSPLSCVSECSDQRALRRQSLAWHVRALRCVARCGNAMISTSEAAARGPSRRSV